VSVRHQLVWVNLIRDSGLFNAPYYQHSSGLPPSSDEALIRHYIDRREAAGLSPNPLLQAAHYRGQLGQPPCALVDYIPKGHNAVDPSPLFDQRFYLRHPGLDIAPAAPRATCRASAISLWTIRAGSTVRISMPGSTV